MQVHKENQQLYDCNSILELAAITVIGDRDDQQDSVGFELRQDEGLIVLCDGMGGHEGGKLASTIAVDEFLLSYNNGYPFENKVEFLEESTRRANKRITELRNNDGSALNAGSTVVGLLISNKELYWTSVGDSRAYLMRDEEFVQFTLDHNYLTVLKEQKNAGLIDNVRFEKEHSRAEALISYLGIGELKLIDYNNESFELKKDDKIIIMTDGLYKLISNEEIARVISNFSNIKDALQALEAKAQKAAKSKKCSRDNMTVALIRII